MSRPSQSCLGFVLYCPVLLFAQEMEYKEDSIIPVSYWDVLQATECSGEAKVSLYTDFKKPNLNEFQSLLEIDSTPKLEVRKLLSGKWRVYISGYDDLDEAKRNISFLKKNANLKSTPFVVCYEESNSFLKAPLLTLEKDVDDSNQYTSQVNQVVLNGNKLGVYITDYINGKPLLSSEVASTIINHSDIDLVEYISMPYEDIPGMFIELDDREQSINLILDIEPEKSSYEIKSFENGNVANYSNYWMNYSSNINSNYSLTGGLNNYLSFERSTVVSKLSFYDYDSRSELSLDSLYLESISEEGPMIYSVGKIQGNPSKIFGVGIEYNRRLLNDDSLLYTPPISFTTGGPAYVELYQGNQLISSMSTSGGESKIESYQYVNTNDLTLVISELGLKKKYITIPYDYSNNMASLYKSGSYEWSAKLGLSESNDDLVVEYDGLRGFDYYSVSLNGYYSTSDRQLNLSIKSLMFGLNNDLLLGYDKTTGAYAGIYISTGDGFNLYGKSYQDNNYQLNATYNRKGLILNDDSLLIDLSNNSSDIYLNQVSVDYSIPNRFGSMTLNYTNSSDDDEYFGLTVSFDLEKLQWYGDVSNRGYYTRASYTSDDRDKGMSVSVRKDNSRIGTTKSADAWLSTEDTNLNVGYSKSNYFETRSMSLSGGAIYSKNSLYLTSLKTPTLMILESNSKTLSARNRPNDDGVLIIPLNSHFASETVSLTEGSVDKSLGDRDVLNVTPKPNGIYHFDVQVNLIKYLVGYVESQSSKTVKGMEVHLGDEVLYIGPNGLISNEITLKPGQDEVLLRIPELNCEYSLPVDSDKLVIDFGALKCADYFI
ncbi:TPA: hypothetical protein I7126_10610 [Vibrio vulnificus]|nr:hypothetical protein [Vibrio vulnificus]HAS6114955.1 hypothetical protein [Vibrio vulnificus]HAS6124083.1 hypothetical protein [Vibrio vulnificus]